MATPLHISVMENGNVSFESDFDGPVVLGRQCEGEQVAQAQRMAPAALEQLIALRAAALPEPRRPALREAGAWRAVIAAQGEDMVSRHHALLEPLAGGGVRITNLSERARIRFEQGYSALEPCTSREMATPVAPVLGRKVVRVERSDHQGLLLQGLAEATVPPGAYSLRTPTPLLSLRLPAENEVAISSIFRWLQVAMDVLQSAAGSSDFFRRAAQAIVDVVGLDSGHVLLCDAGGWTTQAQATAAPARSEADWRPSTQVLRRVREEKRTFWEAGAQSGFDAPSLVGIKVVVAAPILSPQGEVIGALYGDRRQGSLVAGPPQITKLEAMLVELLASGVAAGLARLEQERAVLAARVQFEQFFTPELASQLAAEPDLLQGRDSEVSLLFCDIRSFSSHSARLGPSGTVELISDVMSTLSECVLEQRGVLVDYIGDELMAMWGAPRPQSEHAQLACRAALEMLNRLPALNARWSQVLRAPMDLGIGINTGVARVGNTGSRHKFKYGPLGNTVNLASRLQGATKYLRARLLVSGATRAQLDGGFSARRLGKVRVINIPDPVDLFELAPPGHVEWPALREGYEQALAAFEGGQLQDVTQSLGKLLRDHPDDGPSLVLLSRALDAIIEPPDEFDPVWELPGK